MLFKNRVSFFSSLDTLLRPQTQNQQPSTDTQQYTCFMLTFIPRQAILPRGLCGYAFNDYRFVWEKEIANKNNVQTNSYDDCSRSLYSGNNGSGHPVSYCFKPWGTLSFNTIEKKVSAKVDPFHLSVYLNSQKKRATLARVALLHKIS